MQAMCRANGAAAKRIRQIIIVSSIAKKKYMNTFTLNLGWEVFADIIFYFLVDAMRHEPDMPDDAKS